MIIYPAMDLIGGRVARLRQGRFDDVTLYSANPADALNQFAAAGSRWAHVVDLDGARSGRPMQHEMIAELARTASLQLQVAGGYRDRDQLARMFDAGVARIVVGSLTVKQPDQVAGWLEEFGPEQIVLSLDVRLVDEDPLVAVAGWSEDSGKSLWEVAGSFSEVRHLLITDIGRDGMLEGPNLALYQEVARRIPLAKVQASGGVSSLADLESLQTDGAIIGRALWEGRILLEEALGLARA